MSTFHNKRPFTLIEILVTMGIIAVLAGISVGAFKYVSRHNQETVTKTMMKQIETGLEAVYNRYGYYPPEKEKDGEYVFRVPKDDGSAWGLFNVAPPPAYSKLFIKSVDWQKLRYQYCASGAFVPFDAWKNPLRYRCPGLVNKSSYDLVSAGPDGNFDTTEDNIANYELGN